MLPLLLLLLFNKQCLNHLVFGQFLAIFLFLHCAYSREHCSFIVWPLITCLVSLESWEPVEFYDIIRITASCTLTVLGGLQYCFSSRPVTHNSKTKLIVVPWVTPYPLETLLSPSPRSCDALCKSRSTKHKRWSLQLLLCSDMSIRSGQGPFGYSKKDLWLPKMHTVNKSEPKHVEA